MDHQSGNNPWRLLCANLALLAAYVIAGRLGLLLALPPAYASPIFLPAGIALAACAVGGARLLPAVALGALVVNLLVLLVNHIPLTPALLACAVATTIGATFQAWAGSTVFRHCIDPAIGSGRDVARFVLLAVGVTFVSSTVALAGHVLAGQLQGDTIVGAWLA